MAGGVGHNLRGKQSGDTVETVVEQSLVEAQAALDALSVEPPEAGDVPIIVKKTSDTRAEFTIKGLINCVGVVIRVYGAGGGMDFVAAVGGHFNTPTMYDSESEALTDKGRAFIVGINGLIAEFDKSDLEVQFIVGKPAVESESGGGSEAVVEGTKVANLLKATLGLGGSVDQGDSAFKVSI